MMRCRFGVLACGAVIVFAAVSRAQGSGPNALDSKPLTIEVMEPVELRSEGWFFASVGDRAAEGRVKDSAVEADLRALLGGSPGAHTPVEVEWEGVGSGLILEGPAGYTNSQLRAQPATTWLHTRVVVDDGQAVLNRTWWSWYEPIEGGGERGVVVVLPGMLSTPEPMIEMLMTGLRGRGWGVMRMLAHPSRYSENAMVSTVGREADEIAREFALGVDARMEAMIASVDAALGMIEDQPGPRVLLAMSGGTLAAPGIVASLTESDEAKSSVFDAAVLIGAGADVLTMSETSAYASFLGGLRLDWGEAKRYDPAKLAAISFAYRELETLEPYAMAPKASVVRTLMIQGSKDRAVPARLGDMLWDRLGEPERWLAPMGHELLFYAYLPMKAKALVEWIDETVLVERQLDESLFEIGTP